VKDELLLCLCTVQQIAPAFFGFIREKIAGRVVSSWPVAAAGVSTMLQGHHLASA